jgi:hypothetical protein
MMTAMLCAFLGLQMHVPTEHVSQTADGTIVYRHRDVLPTLRHRDHVPPKGHLFAEDESERLLKTEPKGGL